MAEKKPAVTGTLMFWDKGVAGQHPEGKHAVMVCGILGMPPALAQAFCRDEHLQHLVLGDDVPALGGLRLIASKDEGQPLPDDSYHRRLPVDRLLTSPIWRI